jgi:uncharacterized membrane protein
MCLINPADSVLSFNSLGFLLVYFALGFLFAAFIFAISVVAVPLMYDRHTDALTAAMNRPYLCFQTGGKK